MACIWVVERTVRVYNLSSDKGQITASRFNARTVGCQSNRRSCPCTSQRLLLCHFARLIVPNRSQRSGCVSSGERCYQILGLDGSTERFTVQLQPRSWVAGIHIDAEVSA